MPRAAFKVEAELASESDRRLLQMLSQRLSSKFKSTPAEKMWLSPGWAFNLQLGRDPFHVVLKESTQWQDSWILMVTPGGLSGFLALVRGTDISAGLSQICREIHVFLTNTAGISEVRWYLTGSRTAVATPEELPWRQTAAPG
jgi:hypothetical protein